MPAGSFIFTRGMSIAASPEGAVSSFGYGYIAFAVLEEVADKTRPQTWERYGGTWKWRR